MHALDYLEPLPEHAAGAPLGVALEALRGGTPVAYADAGGWRLVRPIDVVAVPVSRQLCDVPSHPLPTMQIHDAVDVDTLSEHETWGATERGRLLGRIERHRLLEVAARAHDDLEETLGMVARERLMPKLLHDLSNALFVARSAVDPVVRVGAHDVEASAEAVQHAEALLLHMRGLYAARDDRGVESFSLRAALLRLEPMLVVAARPADLEIRLDQGDARVRAHRWRFESSLLNLVLNAAEHGDAVVVQASRPTPALVEVTVDDDGPGFAAATLEALVPDGPRVRGHGLASLRRQVIAMGGDLRLGRSPMGGARVVLRLPAG